MFSKKCTGKGFQLLIDFPSEFTSNRCPSKPEKETEAIRQHSGHTTAVRRHDTKTPTNDNRIEMRFQDLLKGVRENRQPENRRRCSKPSAIISPLWPKTSGIIIRQNRTSSTTQLFDFAGCDISSEELTIWKFFGMDSYPPIKKYQIPDSWMT